RTLALHEAAGQVPILVRKEIRGFILNRLQGALLAEAFRLYADGYASTEDLDKTVRDGLGLRWSFMGPFETIDLNAPGGIADYCSRYGSTYYELARQQAPQRWDDALVRRLEAERREKLPISKVAERVVWRDRGSCSSSRTSVRPDKTADTSATISRASDFEKSLLHLTSYRTAKRRLRCSGI